MLNTIISFDLTTDEQEWAETHRNRLDAAKYFNESRSGRVEIHPAVLIALTIGDGEMWVQDLPPGPLMNLTDEIIREGCDSDHSYAQPGQEWNFIHAWIKGYDPGQLEERCSRAAEVDHTRITTEQDQVVIQMGDASVGMIRDQGTVHYGRHKWSTLIVAVETGGLWPYRWSDEFAW